MADRMLMVTWGGVARGQENRAIECFNDALGILGRRQQAGEIESFDVALMHPNGTLDGFMAIKGSAAQLMALRDDDEWRRNTVEASLCVDGLAHIDGFCDEGVATMMGMYAAAIEGAPQAS